MLLNIIFYLLSHIVAIQFWHVNVGDDEMDDLVILVFVMWFELQEPILSIGRLYDRYILEGLLKQKIQTKQIDRLVIHDHHGNIYHFIFIIFLILEVHSLKL